MTTIAETFRMGPPAIFTYSKKTVQCSNPKLLIGLELETENCQLVRANSLFRSTMDDLGFIIEQDGSLRGVAYEFISSPMYLQTALPVLVDFFAFTKFDESNYTDRCSVHVHVNCLDLTVEQVIGLSLIYSIFEEILFEFVGRDRDSNIFCIPWSHCLHNASFVRAFLKDPYNTARAWQKYTALNLLPLSSKGTVEFRHMHGTADMGKLTTWLNLIGSMFKYIKNTSLTEIEKEVVDLNTTSQYHGFFNRVLGDGLPYNEKYVRKLEEGVILAKYSMIDGEALTMEQLEDTLVSLRNEAIIQGRNPVTGRPSMTFEHATPFTIRSTDRINLNISSRIGNTIPSRILPDPNALTELNIENLVTNLTSNMED